MLETAVATLEMALVDEMPGNKYATVEAFIADAKKVLEGKKPDAVKTNDQGPMAADKVAAAA